MPTILCANKINCVCDDPALAGFNTEARDVPEFQDIAYVQVRPPLGTSWTQIYCQAIGTSLTSDELAQLQAYDNAFQCVVATWTGPDGLPVAVFQNAPQTAIVNCPDGLPFYFSVGGGLFPGLSQAEADEAALSYATQLALDRMICLGDIPATGLVGVPYNAVIVAYGDALAQPPQSDVWQFVGGTLPPGVTLNFGGFVNGMDLITGGMCPINGTPTRDGIYVFAIEVTDPLGDSMQKTYTITVHDPNPDALQDSQGFDILDANGNIITDSF